MLGIVLLNLTPGREPEFFSNLGTVQKVRGVYYLFDEWEVLAEVEGDTVEEAALQSRKVRALPGVEKAAIYLEGGVFKPVEREEFEVPDNNQKRLWP